MLIVSGIIGLIVGAMIGALATRQRIIVHMGGVEIETNSIGELRSVLKALRDANPAQAFKETVQ